MAEKTTNYELIKPSTEDFYDVTVHNDNMDIIDDVLYFASENAIGAYKKVNNLENYFIEESGRLDTTEFDLNVHLEASNPHRITPTTIGLSNVPNVATNDQTPTYTEASTLETLTSGEKLSVAFGKIKKAISTLISHLADATKHNRSTNSGGAIGSNASATYGGAVGDSAFAVGGGALGFNAKTSYGCAIGHNAITVDSSGNTIDAVQLGTGTNNTPKTLQVYGYQLMKTDGTIPSDRIKTMNVSVPKSWTANTSGGYKQTINVSGILATDNPVVDVVLGDDVEANKLYIKAWERISSITTANGSITLYAYDNAPETAFTIKLKVV